MEVPRREPAAEAKGLCWRSEAVQGWQGEQRAAGLERLYLMQGLRGRAPRMLQGAIAHVPGLEGDGALLARVWRGVV